MLLKEGVFLLAAGISDDYITTYYIRDAQGNPLSIYRYQTKGEEITFELAEQNLYGSKRLGNMQRHLDLINAL